MATNWTDPTLSTTIHVRAVHMNELQSVIDQNRQAAGMAGYTWSNTPINAAATHIRALHFTDARNAIQDLWNHASMGSLPSWTIGAPPATTRQVSARDMTDLRNWVQQYENTTGISYQPGTKSSVVAGITILAGAGVDTVTPLNQIVWGLFKGWSGYNPLYAGRYFDPNAGPNASYQWKGGEGTAAKNLTEGVLNKIVPIQSSVVSNQTKTGSAGFSQGQSDASATCLALLANINSGELSIPSSLLVLLYLDVEAGTALSGDYWAGWADYVWHYNVNGLIPFLPAIYCHFTPAGSTYYPDTTIQNALNGACSYGSPNQVACYGFWSTEPEFCNYCDPNPNLTSPSFGSYVQPCGGLTGGVPIMLWQYAQRGSTVDHSGCIGVCGSPSNIFGGQNVDLDEATQNSATDYMLAIN